MKCLVIESKWSTYFIKIFGMSDKLKLPVNRCKTNWAVAWRFGCKRGPITAAGLIVTMSILFSVANFQADSSAKVLESTYPDHS